jgi:hypothetical protein
MAAKPIIHGAGFIRFMGIKFPLLWIFRAVNSPDTRSSTQW